MSMQQIAERLADEFKAITGQYPDMGEWYDDILPEAERLAVMGAETGGRA